MMTKDSLGDRMKEFYEDRAKTYLTRRTPVIIRLDGKAFHTFTRGLKRPYDEILHKTMNSTMQYLCENIQGCRLGYTQSDEITLFLSDYSKLTTDAWFGYAVQKMCSVAASMATMAFNKYFRMYRDEYLDAVMVMQDGDVEKLYLEALWSKLDCAMFDARCFSIPQSEVANCFIWRQQDATRNAIQMLGQYYFSHKELQNKSCNEIQDMLMTQKGVNFNNLSTEFKRGTCCKRLQDGSWGIDLDIPIFTQDRDYIETLVYYTEE